MALDFTNDVMPLFATNVGNDANYQSPGNFALGTNLTGSVGIASVTITSAGTYTSVPTATASSGSATFSTRMKLLSGSTVNAAGTGYAIGNVLTLSGGTKTTAATVTVATAKLVSATIAAGGTGYGNAQTITVTVAGGTSSQAATISVTSDSSGVITTVNSVSQAGSYTVLPTLSANAVTGGSGSGLALNLVFGVNTVTVSQPGVYSALPSNPIAVTGGAGTGFTLTGSWGVQGLVLTNAGTYESVAPTIGFSSGSAAATAVLAPQAETDENTQKLFTLVEIVRSLVAECDNPAQAKQIHEVLRKMMSAMRFGGPTTFSASEMAVDALNSGMRYFASNNKHNAIT